MLPRPQLGRSRHTPAVRLVLSGKGPAQPTIKTRKERIVKLMKLRNMAFAALVLVAPVLLVPGSATPLPR